MPDQTIRGSVARAAPTDVLWKRLAGAEHLKGARLLGQVGVVLGPELDDVDAAGARLGRLLNVPGAGDAGGDVRGAVVAAAGEVEGVRLVIDRHHIAVH